MTAAHLEKSDLLTYFTEEWTCTEDARIEEHLFECAECTRAAEQTEAMVRALREAIPPALTRDRLESLKTQPLKLQFNPMQPGQRAVVDFPKDTHLLIHQFAGVETLPNERVDMEVRVEHGPLLMQALDIPVDRAAKVVHVPCQQHFSHLPPIIVVTLRANAGGQERPLAEYTIDHRFEA